jgi:hypothetical protein
VTAAYDHDVDGLVIPLRSPCAHCGCGKGIIHVRGGQNSVACLDCSRYAYNAPKTETGQRCRSVSTTRAGITPTVRAAVLARARGRCELCGTDLLEVPGWHVAHLLPVEVAFGEGLPDEIINSAANLAAFCEECNLGYKEIVDPVLWLVIMRRRLR